MYKLFSDENEAQLTEELRNILELGRDGKDKFQEQLYSFFSEVYFRNRADTVYFYKMIYGRLDSKTLRDPKKPDGKPAAPGGTTVYLICDECKNFRIIARQVKKDGTFYFNPNESYLRHGIKLENGDLQECVSQCVVTRDHLKRMILKTRLLEEQQEEQKKSKFESGISVCEKENVVMKPAALKKAMMLTFRAIEETKNGGQPITTTKSSKKQKSKANEPNVTKAEPEAEPAVEVVETTIQPAEPEVPPEPTAKKSKAKAKAKTTTAVVAEADMPTLQPIPSVVTAIATAVPPAEIETTKITRKRKRKADAIAP